MTKSLFLGLIFTFMSPLLFAHETNEGPVALEIASRNPIQAGKSILTFQMVDTKTNHLIGDTDLNLAHEKKLHFIIYDPSLSQFQHVHPTYTSTKDSTWDVEVNFTVNGNYWLWAQGELAADGSEFSAPTRLKVMGGAMERPEPTLTDLRQASDEGSEVTLSKTVLKAGRMAMLGLTFSHQDGTAPQLAPYLGAIAHIVAIPSDGDSLIHVHPVAGSSPTTALLHVTFPSPGFYRLWIQFIDGGQLRTVPLAVEVK